MSDIVDPEVLRMASELREILASYQEVEDLITIGAYKPGQNPRVDKAVQKHEHVLKFLKQSADKPCSIEDCWRSMKEIVG
jgi:flagellum-specific ATP synthase